MVIFYRSAIVLYFLGGHLQHEIITFDFNAYDISPTCLNTFDGTLLAR